MSRARNDRNIIQFGPISSSLESEVRRLRRAQAAGEFNLKRDIFTSPEIAPPDGDVMVPGDLNTALMAGFPYVLNGLEDVYASIYTTEYPYKFSNNTGTITGAGGVMLRGDASVKFVEFPSGAVTIIPFVGYSTQGNPFIIEDRLIVPMIGSQTNDVVMHNLSSSTYSVGTNAFTALRPRGAFPYENKFYIFSTTRSGFPGGQTVINEYDLSFLRTPSSPFASGEFSGGLAYGDSIAWATTGTGLYRIDMSDPLNLTVRTVPSILDRVYIRQVNKGFVGDSNRLFTMNYNPTAGLWEIIRIGTGGTRSILPLVFSGNPDDQPNIYDSTGLPYASNQDAIHQPGISPGPDGKFFVYGGIAQDFGELDAFGNPVVFSVPAIWLTDGVTTQRVWTLPDTIEYPYELLYVRSERSHAGTSLTSTLSTLNQRLREGRMESCVSYLEYDANSRTVNFMVRVGSGYLDFDTPVLLVGTSESRLYRVQL